MSFLLYFYPLLQQQSKLITQRQRDEDPKDFQNDTIDDSIFELEENT